MYKIFPCKGMVTADSQENYKDRFIEEGGIHICDDEVKILTVKKEYNAGRMNNLMNNYRNASKRKYVDKQPLLYTSAQFHKLLVEELSYLRYKAIRNKYASLPTLDILITLKNIAQRIGFLGNMPLSVLESNYIASYFHTHIDAQYSVLLISHICPLSFEFGGILNYVVEDMITLAYRTYEHYESSGDLKISTPFLCHCHRQLWLILLKIHECCKFVSASLFDKLKVFIDKTWKSSNLFRLWLFRHLYSLDLYDALGESTNSSSCQLQKNHDAHLQDAFNRITTANSEQLLPALNLIHLSMTDMPLLNPSIITYKIIWEYFYKSMSRGAIEFAVSNSVSGMLSLRQSLISCAYPPTVIDPNNALLIFLQMLLGHLKKYPDDWKKLQSRFYTRFLPERMSDFHISVVHAVAFIYLTLTEINFQELRTKVLDILRTLPGRSNQIITLWNFHMTLITLNIEKGENINDCSECFMPLVTTAANSGIKQHDLVCTFITRLKTMFDVSNAPISLYKLIEGNWIAAHMLTCTTAEFIDVVDLLEKVLNISASNTQMWLTLENSLRARILRQMETILSKRSDYPSNIGIFISRVAKRSSEFKPIIIQFYTGDKCMNLDVSMMFLSDFLSSYPDDVSITTDEEWAFVQLWVRYMICNIGTTNTSCSRTGCIFKLRVLNRLIPNNHRDETQNWRLKDLRLLFREAIARDGCTKELREIAIHCFDNVDTTVRNFLERTDARKTKTREEMLRILNVLTETGLIIEDCGPLLHKDNQPGSKLSRLLAVTLLAQDTVYAAPGTLSSEWLHCVKQVWHLYYTGLRSVRSKMLHHEQVYIDRMLHELIVRYVRHYPIAQSPIAQTMLANVDTELEYILRHISVELTRYTDKVDKTNALQLISYTYDGIDSRETVKLNVVRTTVPSLLEFIMTNQQEGERANAPSLLKRMEVNSVNAHLVITVEALVAIARNKMMFQGAQVFGLLKTLTKEFYDVVEAALVDVEKNIIDVEQRQGVQRNSVLRNLFEMVQASLP